MAKPRKQWGELSPRSRERASRQAAQNYGLTRKQARERFNRGTYKPFAHEPAARAPIHAPAYPVSLGPELKDAAFRNMDDKLGDDFKWNAFAVRDAIDHKANMEALIRMAGASEDELRTWASYQTKRGNKNYKPTTFNRDLNWYDSGSRGNIFWYH